jgi:DeoR/GlpR family transcriptional regulator of sugar metabolism
VTCETVRRDIGILAECNQLKQIRGGAISLALSEPHFEKRQTVNVEGKQAIGLLAARLVSDGASLIVGSGTTKQAVARALVSHSRLTILTNDINICLNLGRINGNKVTLLGGVCRNMRMR